MEAVQNIGHKPRRSVVKRQKREESRSNVDGTVVAKISDVPSSPRKMRLVADLIRGERINKALSILKYQPKIGARKLEKLLLSAIANWQAKYEDLRIEDADLFVKEIFVDGGRMLKRLRPAPQGRAYRVRKRSNHVTLVLGTANSFSGLLSGNTNPADTDSSVDINGAGDSGNVKKGKQNDNK